MINYHRNAVIRFKIIKSKLLFFVFFFYFELKLLAKKNVLSVFSTHPAMFFFASIFMEIGFISTFKSLQIIKRLLNRNQAPGSYKNRFVWAITIIITTEAVVQF